MSNTADLHSRLAQRIRTAREITGRTQLDLARHLGLHRPSVSEIEAGRRTVSVIELCQLIALFDVDCRYFLDDGPEPPDLPGRYARFLGYARKGE